MSNYVHPEMLVSAEWLLENLDNPDIRIVEVSALGEPTYGDGHIRNAIYWPWKETLWDRTNREFLSPSDFATLMSRSGITPETTIIFYSDRIQFATYALWTCILRGHTNAKILNGSRKHWIESGYPMTTDVLEPSPSSYPLRPPNETGRISRDGVLAGLGDPNRVLLDGRTPEEYNGERVKPAPSFDHGAERKGRIPGAKHLFYKELLNDDETLKPVDELRQAFEARGATADKDIVAYCRLSHRASFLWFVGYFLLGYPRIRSYDGSWTEWGSMVGMPVEID